VTEILIDDEASENIQTTSRSIDENEKLMREIQIYEKRIQGLIEGIGMLKEKVNKKTRRKSDLFKYLKQMRNHADPEQTDQLRSDIDSSLHELEQLQENYAQRISNQRPRSSRSQSSSPSRYNNYRSSSMDERRSTTPKVSFRDDPIIKRYVFVVFLFITVIWIKSP
jgi:DNA repair exonuclease SbcCD ATPase subunit